MGIKHANPIPAFLPRDMSFRYKRLNPTADLPSIIASVGQLNGHIDNLYEMVNELSAETERRVGLMRNSFTRANYLPNGWFRQHASGVPRKWTSAGAGVAFSIQTAQRTDGMFNGNAARIAAGANAGTLTATVTDIGVGTKWSLTGWIKITTGSGTVTITPNGTNPVIMRFPFSAATYGTGWFCFPSLKAAVGHIDIPSDATQISIELKADANSTIDFSELQLGPGTVGYPTMYVKAPEDIVEIVQIGALPANYGSSGQYMKTDGAGALSWDTPSGGISATEFDAKGDLLVGTGSDTFNNLPVGTNGNVIVADSGEAMGIKWTDAPTFNGVTTTGTTAFSAGGSNGTNLQHKYFIENVQCVAGLTTNLTTNTVPAGATVVGVSCVVSTAVPAAALAIQIQDNQSGVDYSAGYNLGLAAGSTTNCMSGIPHLPDRANPSALRVNTQADPLASTGYVRVRVDYVLATAPTS